MQKPNALKRILNRIKNKPEKLTDYVWYLSSFATKCLKKSSADGYVLGISGGIDSALCLAILSKTPNIKTLGVFIDIESQEQDLKDAQSLSDVFKFEYKYINLTDEYRLLVKKLGIENNKLAQINLKVRLRMITLYALAQANNLLVCGTSNADERLVGYFTKFGDNACDVSLLAYLNKAQITFLSGCLEVPLNIINKKPSAGLYVGQTDEQDMEITYQEIDHYLSFAVIDQIQDQKITTRYIRNKHKLTAPILPKKFMKLRNTK